MRPHFIKPQHQFNSFGHVKPANVAIRSLDTLPEVKSDQIFFFDWSRHERQLVLARGSSTSDVVLINDLRQSARRQTKRSHLFAITYQQNVADQHGVIPSLAFDCFETSQLREPVWRCSNKRQLTLL